MNTKNISLIQGIRESDQQFAVRDIQRLAENYELVRQFKEVRKELIG